MPTPKKGARLGGSPSHHNMMVSNLATELFRHGRIKTTKSKAKTMQPVAERMITFAKRGDLHARRQVLTVIRDKDVVHKLFADIGPAAADRNGGYTRIVNIGHRKGDNAPMALIELVDIIDDAEGESTLTEAPSRRWSLRRRRNNMSKAAREREEAIMAAEDAGEDTYVDPTFDDAELADGVPVGSVSAADDDDSLAAAQITERELSARASGDGDEDSDGPEVSPEDVEARLAADDADDADEVDDEAVVEVDEDNEVAEASDDSDASDASADDASDASGDEEE